MTLPSVRCDLPIAFRDYRAEDNACVVSSWVHSYRSSDWARLMHPSTYGRTQRVIAEALLAQVTAANGPARLVVACASDDPDMVYGWVCGEAQPRRTVLHYIWVKPPFRQQGIGAALVVEFMRRHGADQTAPCVVSHATDAAYRIVRSSAPTMDAVGSRNAPHLRFNPVLALNSNFEVAL